MIRNYQPGDLARLKVIHQAQGFDYAFPDVQSPAFISKRVLEVKGEIAVACLARLTTELYLLQDPHTGTPASRWQQLQTLQADVESELFGKGADDCHVWVPPALVKSFGRRLVERMGYVRDDRYTPFCKYLEPGALGPPVKPLFVKEGR